MGNNASTAARFSAILVALIVVLAAPIARSAGDPLLARLVGDWVGRGTFRAGPSAAPEALYCRIHNRLKEGGTVLAQSGRCAIPDHSGPISGRITARGSGSYEGTLESFSTKGPAFLAGRGTTDHIQLTAQFVDRLSGVPAEALFTLTVAGKSGYRLTSSILDATRAPTYVASDILFSPN